MENERELSRVYHYCSLLGLNSMDRKDIVKLFEIELSIGDKTGSYIQQRRKIQKLGLDNVYGEIAERLNDENSDFKYNKSVTNLSETEIWTEVYKKNDDIFKKLIDRAKNIEKDVSAERGGCMIILPILFILVPLSLWICFLAE